MEEFRDLSRILFHGYLKESCPHFLSELVCVVFSFAPDVYLLAQSSDDLFSDEILELDESALESKEFIMSVDNDNCTLNHELVSALKTLWDEPVIQLVYDTRSVTKIEDSSAYFWNRLGVISIYR